jgi:dihydrolipoamide dehydrogenase
VNAILDGDSPAQWDVIVIGSGSGGEIAAAECAGRGLRVLVVEADRFGGECAYVACVPSKSLLLSAHAGLRWEEAIRRRDQAAHGRDDRATRDTLTDAGVTTVRARGRLLAPEQERHRVLLEPADTDASRREISGPRVETTTFVVLGTGSETSIPPVQGLDGLGYWTSDQALSTTDQPVSMIIMGGGAVGCELAQAFALLGTRVDLIEVADGLLPSESGWVGTLIAEQLEEDAVKLHLGVEVQRVEASENGCRVHLDDGSSISAERLLLAGGRSPRSAGLGLDALDVAPADDGSIPIDGRCGVLAADGSTVGGLYAVGDVTAESSYTHSANYQARIAADDIVKRGHDADYRAVPRVVYTRPTVFCVGGPAEQARERGFDVRTARTDLADVERGQLVALSASPTGRGVVRGKVELVTDPRTGTLVGASCVGPEADSWGAELALAIRAEIPIALLAQHMRAFPTWSEAVTAALDD